MATKYEGAEKNAPVLTAPASGELQPALQQEQPHSIFSKRQCVANVYIASLAAFASPVSSSIYYPAMLTLAHDLNTSLTNINLTITTYVVCPSRMLYSRQPKANDITDLSRYCPNNCGRHLR
jgi:hypothetical protein